MTIDNSKRVLRDIEIDAYLFDCTQIEPLAINEEFARIPADLAYWNQRYADTQRDAMLAKVNAERAEARAYLDIRERAAAAGEKVTEKYIDAQVATDPTVIDARMAQVEADAARVRLQGVLDAVRAKKDMLVSLGASLRAEMNGDPSIRAAHAEARMYRNGG